MHHSQQKNCRAGLTERQRLEELHFTACSYGLLPANQRPLGGQLVSSSLSSNHSASPASPSAYSTDHLQLRRYVFSTRRRVAVVHQMTTTELGANIKRDSSAARGVTLRVCKGILGMFVRGGGKVGGAGGRTVG